mgnify:CR=1 FL=1
MQEKNILLHASEHQFLLSFSETLMLRNYSRSKKYKYCSQIGGSESIRDIQEAKNIDADAFEFQIVESVFSISKIFQALEKTYSDCIEELSSKYIFINISNQESLNLLNDLKNYHLPDNIKKIKIIINYDRRNLIKWFFKLKNNDFEVFQYEDKINKLIYDSYKKINNNKFLISISGGITSKSLVKLKNSKILLDFLKTGLFSIKVNKKNISDLKKSLFHFQSLEEKLIKIMNSSINNKTTYLEKRKIHLTNYFNELQNK